MFLGGTMSLRLQCCTLAGHSAKEEFYGATHLIAALGGRQEGL